MSSSVGWLLWRCWRVVGWSTTTELSQQLAKDPVFPTIETTTSRAGPFLMRRYTHTHCTACVYSRCVCAQQSLFNNSGRSEGRIRNETTMRAVFCWYRATVRACLSVFRRAPPAKKKFPVHFACAMDCETKWDKRYDRWTSYLITSCKW
jgi:hypothetical protein